jgi:hypothetical protein
MFVRQSTYDTLRNAHVELLASHDDLMRLFTNARRRNEALRDDREAYKAEADHYRQLTADLEARLEAVTVIRSEFEALRDKLELI